MTTFPEWLDVQNGADVRGLETYTNGTGAMRLIVLLPRLGI
ncbi:hypothetical protein CWATWH0401_138 [Crocosphaera watsonii WH 0401]|uniref:Uncharacterized protein n=1 Tax=Crocosphaera watsonii WH 0401 TaxID=555881 RepID=T2J6M7_CROWT|nr:hypothetical protein CWATWH0401_138 [Crocosphaera watsonii WH 0401]